MFQDFGKLRVFQILKSDAKYESVFENRIKRLDLWKSKTVRGSTEKKFRMCIRLSKKCQKIAESLEQARIDLLATYPTSTEQAVNRVTVMLLNSMQGDKELQKLLKTDIGRIVKEQQEADYRVAERIVLEAITKKWAKDEKTLGDFVNKRIHPEDDLHDSSTKMTIATLYHSVNGYLTFISACMSVSEMAELYRGLFYMGIINIEGGKIDNKIILDHAKEIGSEAVMAVLGNIPGVGLFLSGAKIVKEVTSAIQEFRDVDVIPDVIESTNFVEEYLTKYHNALFEWKKVAEPTIIVLNRLTKSSKRFIAG